MAGVDPVENALEVMEEAERRLAHDVEHMVGGVFRGDFETPRYVVEYELLVVSAVSLVNFGAPGVVHRQVIAHAAAYKGLLDSRQSVYAVVDFEQTRVVGVEVGTWLGVEARRAQTSLASLGVASAHAVHVGRRPSEIGYVAFEVGHACYRLGFAHYRLQAP